MTEIRFISWALRSCCPIFLAATLIASPSARAQTTRPAGDGTSSLGAQEPQPARPTLPYPTTVERQSLDRLLAHEAWPCRAIAAMRLERYGCEPSRVLLESLLRDKAWQVRCFAVRSLGRQRMAPADQWFDAEDDPHVVRTALRYRYRFDLDRLGHGMRTLAKSRNLSDRMTAAELGAASGDAELVELARDTARQVILRMDRIDAGALSPRLSLLTGQNSLRRHYHWQNWMLKVGRGFEIEPAYLIEEGKTPPPPSLLAQLDAEQFAGMEQYMADLSTREVDLAILLDCTASMSGEISAAQGGIDDLMLFVSDVVSSLRVAIVAYRDRSDEFETRGWEFTDDLPQARQQLWQLSADGGGDEPESVYPALSLACTKLTWRPESAKVLVLLGDAPPHVGTGSHCVNLVAHAREKARLTTHVIQCEGKPVKHFAEIAKAGGGRCVALGDDDALVAEITGLTLGDRYEAEFREFFRVYLELCR